MMEQSCLHSIFQIFCQILTDLDREYGAWNPFKVQLDCWAARLSPELLLLIYLDMLRGPRSLVINYQRALGLRARQCAANRGGGRGASASVLRRNWLGTHSGGLPAAPPLSCQPSS